jgi:chromosome segregation ATPase
MSPASPIHSPPMRPQDWLQDKAVQDYISELRLQTDEQVKKLEDQTRLSTARLREQDVLITELQEKLDATEDELKERKKELGELRTKDARYEPPKTKI